MNNLPLINSSDQGHSKDKLAAYYKNGLIPAEKKEYLTKLRSSQGPYMGIEGKNGETKFLMDAASQIATLGLGFNPTSFFGPAHFLETWTNDKEGANYKAVNKALHHFLQRKLNWESLSLTYCHSGAEANETALGYCYQNRRNKNAKKVLAFEGSFHGRMMVTLSSTWNKTKREPFEWPGYDTIYSPFPELPDDNFNLEVTEEWRRFWDESPAKNCLTPENWNNDPVLKSEFKCLLKVRESLITGQIFAIIVEPMQCEGGDRYGSNRFFTGLLLMAKSFGVPVIFDEVQTGFHLGREFFWHRQFNLENRQGEQLQPDYVVCAKKSQAGMVMSHHRAKETQEFQVASVLRGYVHAMMLDQSQSNIMNMEKDAKALLVNLVSKYDKHLARPRATGISFAFDVLDKEFISKFIAKRFDHGLLYYPAGSNTLRFRLNTAYKKDDLSYLFERLDAICDELFNGKEAALPEFFPREKSAVDRVYEWHELLLETKINAINGKTITEDEAIKVIQEKLSPLNVGSVVSINKDNFSKYRDEVEKFQKKIYEPTRQTPIKNFEQCFTNKNGTALVIEDSGSLRAIAFSGSLKNFPYDRGTRRDPSFSKDDALYMVDVTVDHDSQGMGLGRELKYALSFLAIAKNAASISGRNRDRLAGPMLNINLSLGSFELNHLEEDYPDDETHRDSIYYSCPLQWTPNKINLSSAIDSPLGQLSLNKTFVQEQLDVLVNKVCLSNFVSERFLSHLRDLVKLAPDSLQHAYTASGQSECVDKIAKSIWFNKKERNHQLTFDGHFFGLGSFLSRSLSEGEDFFPVTSLPHPDGENGDEILKNVEQILKENKTMAVWIEPIRQKYCDRVSKRFLQSLRSLCDQYQVQLVFNETASKCYRYNGENYFASELDGITPDAMMLYMGGQAAMVAISKDIFVEKPLMMISTWDGDEFAFANFHQAVESIQKNKIEFIEMRRIFAEVLNSLLSRFEMTKVEINHGVGYFEGNIPDSIASHFTFKNGRYLVCPSYDSMQLFLKTYGEEI